MAIRRFSNSSIATGAKSSKLWDGETFPGYFESIASAVVSSSGAASITFDNIPQNYTHLQIRGFHQEPTDSVQLQFNDSNSNVYTNHEIVGTGTSVTNAYTSSTLSQWGIIVGTNYGSSGSNFGACVVDLIEYSNTSKYKLVRSITGADNNSSFSRVAVYGGMWFSNNAITKIKLFPRTSGYNFAQYTHFALYGMRVS